MSIPFHCPHCQLFTLVDDEYAGLAGPCASCGKVVTVPPSQTAGGSVAGAPHQIRRDSSLAKVLLIVVSCMAVCLVVLITAGLLVAPALTIAQKARHKRSCSENLRRIGLALAQYHDRHGSYPPAVVYDSAGKPMHSWRVLILPELGEQALFDEYRMNEPWDSPANMLVQRKMPDVFHCEGDEDAKLMGETSFMVVVGPKTAFPKNGQTRRNDIVDDPALTILVTEVHGHGTSWTQPKDLDFLQLRVNSDGMGGIGANHEDGFNILFADQHVDFVTDVIADEHLQSMSTINGGELIPWTELGLE